MSGLTYVLLSGGMLAALWLFVLLVMWTIRTDLFGPKVKRLPGKATPAAVPPAAPAAGADPAKADGAAGSAEARK